MLNLAVIGIGRRAGSLVGQSRRYAPEFRVVATADPDAEATAINLLEAGIRDVELLDDVDALLANFANFDGL